MCSFPWSLVSRECVYAHMPGNLQLTPLLPPGVLKPESGPWRLCHWGSGRSWLGARLGPLGEAGLQVSSSHCPQGARGAGSKNHNQRKKSLSLQFLLLDLLFQMCLHFGAFSNHFPIRSSCSAKWLKTQCPPQSQRAVGTKSLYFLCVKTQPNKQGEKIPNPRIY